MGMHPSALHWPPPRGEDPLARRFCRRGGDRPRTAYDTRGGTGRSGRRRTRRPHAVVDRHGQSPEAEARTEEAHPGPAVGAVEGAGRDRAHRAADEVADHVRAVDPAAGVGTQRVDHGLVRDLHALGADVEHDDPGDERAERGVAGPQQCEGADQQDAGGDGGGGDMGRVGQLAGEVGRDDPAGTDEPEEPDHRVGVAVRAAREQEGQRRPQHAEHGERAGAVPGPAAQHRLGGQQPERRADEVAGSCGAGGRPRSGRARQSTTAKQTMRAAESQ